MYSLIVSLPGNVLLPKNLIIGVRSAWAAACRRVLVANMFNFLLRGTKVWEKKLATVEKILQACSSFAVMNWRCACRMGWGQNVGAGGELCMQELVGVRLRALVWRSVWKYGESGCKRKRLVRWRLRMNTRIVANAHLFEYVFYSKYGEQNIRALFSLNLFAII